MHDASGTRVEARTGVSAKTGAYSTNSHATAASVREHALTATRPVGVNAPTTGGTYSRAIATVPLIISAAQIAQVAHGSIEPLTDRSIGRPEGFRHRLIALSA
jgi:hypothetical protein